ncbi:unnamed protein product [Hydatigera taeniaeformis]|uniref:FERM domain-containing protein n=1 Tax=Hydatigena taeniaeformis TaxID=6205 RepID=A0A0R3X3D1_HYDTA|nr:unnamed protein product [Hydatigera taeniaeformis]
MHPTDYKNVLFAPVQNESGIAVVVRLKGCAIMQAEFNRLYFFLYCKQRDSRMSATEYMRRLRIMKMSLAMEMLTRAYIRSKANSSCPRIPGIQIPEDQIFFVLLIQSVCTKPAYSDIGLTESCETALLAAELAPTFMSLVGCNSDRAVALSLTNTSTAPTYIIPAKCFK